VLQGPCTRARPGVLLLCLIVHECSDLLAGGHRRDTHRIGALADCPDKRNEPGDLQRVCNKYYDNRAFTGSDFAQWR